MPRLRHGRALAAFCLLALGTACPDAAPEGPPDVYLVVIDTLRSDRLSCYGYERETSPFLDELAAEGALFLDNTSQSSWTKPSMVSLMSGAYVTAYRDLMPDDVPSLAQSFQAAGYHTIGVVGNVLLSPKLGFDRGFDHYDAREITDAERAEMKARGLREPVCRPVQLMLEDLRPHLEAEFDRRAAGEHRPLLTYLHPMEPHDPYERNAEFERALPDADLDGQIPTEWHRAKASDLQRELDSEEVVGEWHTMNAQRGRYDREVRAIDDHLRRFFADLEARGHLDNAIIAIVSDHGEGLYEPLAMMRREAREEAPLVRVFQQGHGRNLDACLIRTPFILWGPGVPEGRVVEQAVENVDLYPTLLELCGAAPPPSAQGRSLVPLLRGATDEWKRDMHAFTLFATCIRERATGLKLVLVSNAGRKLEATHRLVDTLADPEERVNLYDERPDDVARLRGKLEQWQAAFPMTSTDPESVDPEHLRHMRALGYIGDE